MGCLPWENPGVNQQPFHHPPNRWDRRQGLGIRWAETGWTGEGGHSGGRAYGRETIEVEAGGTGEGID